LIALTRSKPDEQGELDHAAVTSWSNSKVVDAISDETVRRTLKKKRPQAVQTKQRCISKVTPLSGGMEDAYAEAYDPRRPVVCFG